jgi:histidine triad (HIT) family protein
MIPDCIFCKIIAGLLPSEIIAQNDDICVIKDIAPKASIHYLIMPKKHIKDLRSLEAKDCCLGSKMLKMAQQLSLNNEEAKDFRLVINNGYNAGQRVFHLHMHFLAGSKAFSEF